MKYDLDRLPIFRSPSQVAVLVDVLLGSHPSSSLTDIATRTGVSVPGVHKEVERLERAGLVRSSRHGRNRVVHANDNSSYVSDLRSLLVKAFGPPALLEEALVDLDRIDAAFIYGSWAEGASAANDIDLMIIGAPQLDVLYERVRAVEDLLGIPVGVTVLSSAEWTHAESGFVQNVRESPKLQVL